MPIIELRALFETTLKSTEASPIHPDGVFLWGVLSEHDVIIDNDEMANGKKLYFDLDDVEEYLEMVYTEELAIDPQVAYLRRSWMYYDRLLRPDIICAPDRVWTWTDMLLRTHDIDCLQVFFSNKNGLVHPSQHRFDSEKQRNEAIAFFVEKTWKDTVAYVVCGSTFSDPYFVIRTGLLEGMSSEL